MNNKKINKDEEIKLLKKHIKELEKPKAAYKLRKETQMESEKNFYDLAENLLDGLAIADENGYHIYVNHKFSEITGYSRDELYNMTGWDFTPLEDHAKLKQRMKDRIAGNPVQTHYERIIIKKDGTYVPVEMSTTLTLWQGKKRPLAIIRDITEHKQEEERLRTHEAQLSNTMEIAKLGYWEYDVESDLFTFNDHFYDIFRTTAEKAGGYTMTPVQYA